MTPKAPTDSAGPHPMRPELVASALDRLERAKLLDRWLASLLPARSGIALVAVGGLGRCEPAPYGDLDLILVHEGVSDARESARALWYPIWDAGLRLDHSVRTVKESLEVVGVDVLAGLGLLDLRLVSGDEELAERLRVGAMASWRKKARTLLPLLRAERDKRGALAGDTAFLVEPDLKEGRGGLRDVQVLRGLAAAQLSDPPKADVESAYTRLLDVRDALQTCSHRGTDVLIRQEQIPVMETLGLASEDDLLRAVSDAARTISFAVSAGWRRVASSARTGRTSNLRMRRKSLIRTPMLDGVVEHGGEVCLARAADPAEDSVLPLRVATAAAESRLPIAPATLAVLVNRHSPLAHPWPLEGRAWFVRLLGAGRGIIDVVEAFDQSGLLADYLPEWQRIRGLPQRHPAHLYTVDRHLVETAVVAGELTRRVRRPDLLLMAALLHDIGKGGEGDHCIEGAEIAAAILARMGLPAAEVATVTLMVGQHLLLPHTALRRDPTDSATIDLIIDRVEGRLDYLALLHALAEADARATGPGVWSPWRAHVIGELVTQVTAALAPDDRPADARDEQSGPTTDRDQAGHVAKDGTLRLSLRPDLDGFEVVVGAADQPGLLSQIAGVLALHQLEIRHAAVSSLEGQAHDVFAVRPLFGRPPDPSLLAADLRSSLAGSLPLAERLSSRERAYERGSRLEAPTEVIWYDDAAESATVVEVRAPDRSGLLYRLTSVFEQAGVDVLSARVETFGADAIDVFYLSRQDASGEGTRWRLSAMLQAAGGRP